MSIRKVNKVKIRVIVGTLLKPYHAMRKQHSTKCLMWISGKKIAPLSENELKPFQ